MSEIKEYHSSFTGPEVDALLTKVKDGSVTADIKKELANKANVKGRYPEMSVGFADDLVGRGESVPASFGFRASGGKSIKDGRAYIKAIKGNSVVWNQTMEKPYTKFFTNRVTYSIENNVVRCVVNSIAYPFVGIYSDKVEKQHTYLVAFKYLGNKNAYVEGGIEIQGQGINIAANKLTQFTAIKKASNTAHIGFVMSTAIESMEIGDTFEVHDINVYDLTKMFQAGNEPTTIEDFNARVATLGVDLNAYNEGEVIHCNAESIKSVGDNAWDEQWENGTFDITSGEAIDESWVMVQIRSKNPLPVLPNEEYYVSIGKASIWVIFLDKEGNAIESPAHNGITAGNAINIYNGGKFKTPTNAAFLIFYCTSDYGSTYNHDILISLYHSGWKAEKDNQYQPYWQDILPLPIIRKYFPQGMKKAGSAHDEIRYNKASGKWERTQSRFADIDLGSLTWYMSSETYPRFFAKLDGALNPSASNLYANILCAKYVNMTAGHTYNGFVGIALDNQGYLRVYDPSYADAASFKASLQGVMLYYESNDWEWVELDAEDQNFNLDYRVADFGTEQAIAEQPSAPISADIIYQFNAVDMIREHELEIAELQSIIATMQAQLASLTNKE